MERLAGSLLVLGNDSPSHTVAVGRALTAAVAPRAGGAGPDPLHAVTVEAAMDSG
ncbi:hypothetical protein [Streptomyces sp. NPDC048603]|uniref:hypothetical protein n=1 Tax=Streptomyces sp. NPDC048603 TaxID=3365577 RepID=UPI003717401A